MSRFVLVLIVINILAGCGWPDCIPNRCTVDWNSYLRSEETLKPINDVFATGAKLFAVGQSGFFASVDTRGDITPLDNRSGTQFMSLWISDDNEIYMAGMGGIYMSKIGTEATIQRIDPRMKPDDPNYESLKCNSLAIAGHQLFAACASRIVFGDPSKLELIATHSTNLSTFSDGQVKFIGNDIGEIYRGSPAEWPIWKIFGAVRINAGIASGLNNIIVAGSKGFLTSYDGLTSRSLSGDIPDNDGIFSEMNIEHVNFNSIIRANTHDRAYIYVAGTIRDGSASVIIRGEVLQDNTQVRWESPRIFEGENFVRLHANKRNVYVVGSKGTAGVIRCRPLDG